jgi:VanZ family protein
MSSTATGTAEPAVPRLAPVWYGIGAVMLLTVAALSLMPVPSTGVNDKLSHLVTYFLLAGWFALLAAKRATLIWVLVGVAAYGGLLELLQAMTPHRQAEWADLLANSLGAASGIWLYFTPLRRLLLLIDRGLARLLQR